MSNQKLILVIGATGTQGGAVTRHLLKKGFKIRALTRDPSGDKAKLLQEQGIELFKGGLDDVEILKQAMKGVQGVFSVQNFWTTGKEKEIEQGKNVADAAKTVGGLEHFVYTSVGGAASNTGIIHFDSKYQIEQHIKQLELPFTIIRPSFFMENLIFFPEMKDQIASGQIYFGQDPEKRMQMVAVDDIGGFVSTIFSDKDKYLGKSIEFSSDEMLPGKVFEKLGSSINKELSYHYVPYDGLVQNAGEETALMFKWFNEKGYFADISQLRLDYSGLTSYDDWLTTAPLEYLSVI
ncbi:MAG: NmrA/HSCARG family protein [Candidatus Heimdallarchaeota archaeon]|nr:NmrA/HSCARG family protein [Candidatus Heimdallarchaeota archaeon]